MRDHLAKQILDINPGEHLCLFYDKDPAEQLPALLPFVHDALSNDEQFIYVADDQTVEELSERLRESGVNVEAETHRGALKLWTRHEWRQPGELSSEKKSFQVMDLIRASRASGFRSSRFAVEMTWTVGPAIDVALLEHWEATINNIFLHSRDRIICQYNRKRLAPEVLFAALHTHPLAIIGDCIYPNLFYEAPLILDRNGNGNSAAARVDWMIGQLKRARAAQQEREELIEKQAALAQAQLSRADLEKRVQERTVALESAHAALLCEVEEQRRLEEQLRQAQRLESVGTLAGGVAHDFNNILNIIRGYSLLIGRHAAGDEAVADALTVIEEEIERGAALVRQLLTVARKTDAQLTMTNINDELSQVGSLLSQTLPKTIAVTVNLDPAVPALLADANQINQALLNICVNARDAMPAGGSITLTSKLVAGNGLPQENAPAKAQHYVCIEVKDTGSGMEPSVRSRIFEPFYTTKGVGQGTGLGLAIVYSIMQNHDGFVTVDSQPGQGATFRLYFPVVFQPDTSDFLPVAERESAQSKGTPARATVLVAEDEPHMADLLEKVLKERGHRVLVARDGEEVVHVFSTRNQEIDIVLLDLGLPKISGWDVISHIRDKQPNANIVVASGYLEPAIRAKMHQLGVKEFVHKPYVPEVMVDKLQALVQRKEI